MFSKRKGEMMSRTELNSFVDSYKFSPEAPTPNRPRLRWDMGRGEPVGGKTVGAKAQERQLARGNRKITSASRKTKRGMNRIKQ